MSIFFTIICNSLGDACGIVYDIPTQLIPCKSCYRGDYSLPQSYLSEVWIPRPFLLLRAECIPVVFHPRTVARVPSVWSVGSPHRCPFCPQIRIYIDRTTLEAYGAGRYQHVAVVAFSPQSLRHLRLYNILRTMQG